MFEQTRKCPVCGRPYKVYSLYAGDQSACPSCVAEAERQITTTGDTKDTQDPGVWARI